MLHSGIPDGQTQEAVTIVDARTKAVFKVSIKSRTVYSEIGEIYSTSMGSMIDDSRWYFRPRRQLISVASRAMTFHSGVPYLFLRVGYDRLMNGTARVAVIKARSKTTMYAISSHRF